MSPTAQHQHGSSKNAAVATSKSRYPAISRNSSADSILTNSSTSTSCCSSPLQAVRNPSRRTAPPPPPRIQLSPAQIREREAQAVRDLEAYLDANYAAESAAVHAKKQDVLHKLQVICQDWFQHVSKEREYEVQLLIGGSFRLGVCQDEDDVDVTLVVPSASKVTHRDFFSDREQSLIARLRVDCEMVLAIQTAYVPLIKLQWSGVSIDLLFAASRGTQEEEGGGANLDLKSQASLNGPMVTEHLLRVVGEANLPKFRVVLRALRHWAKLRGLYNNKFGFWGGINYAIVATLVCQLFSELDSAKLVGKAMSLLSEWDWNKPMQLCDEYPVTCQVMMVPHAASSCRSAMTTTTRNFMPILTPATAVSSCTNSALSVTKVTRQILLQEFKRSSNIINNSVTKPHAHCLPDWQTFFQPNCAAPAHFFSRFPLYISVTAEYDPVNDNNSSANTLAASKQWELLVESRIRKFCDVLEQSFSLVFPHQHASPTRHGSTWYIGLDLTAQQQHVSPLDIVCASFVESCMREARGDATKCKCVVNVVRASESPGL